MAYASIPGLGHGPYPRLLQHHDRGAAGDRWGHPGLRRQHGDCPRLEPAGPQVEGNVERRHQLRRERCRVAGRDFLHRRQCQPPQRTTVGCVGGPGPAGFARPRPGRAPGRRPRRTRLAAQSALNGSSYIAVAVIPTARRRAHRGTSWRLRGPWDRPDRKESWARQDRGERGTGRTARSRRAQRAARANGAAGPPGPFPILRGIVNADGSNFDHAGGTVTSVRNSVGNYTLNWPAGTFGCHVPSPFVQGYNTTSLATVKYILGNCDGSGTMTVDLNGADGLWFFQLVSNG